MHTLGAKMHAMIKKAKNKASLVLLLLTLTSVIFLHVEWTTSENGTLLVVDNQEIDLVGAMTNQWIRLTRNCAAVSQLQPTDAKYQRAKLLIKNYSPPNSESAQIAGAWTAGEWTLIEVEFTELLPAVVLIQTKENHSFIVPDAVWSGYTKPWKSAPFIRQYISKNRSDMPTALTDCFEPQSLSFLQ